MSKAKATAYLLARVQLRAEIVINFGIITNANGSAKLTIPTPPTIDTVMIRSQNATAMTFIANRETYLDIFHVDGETYEEAEENLRRCIVEHPGFAWCIRLLES